MLEIYSPPSIVADYALAESVLSRSGVLGERHTCVKSTGAKSQGPSSQPNPDRPVMQSPGASGPQQSQSPGAAFRQLRHNAVVMARIYSHMSTTDRVRLGEVDRKFLHDEQRGSVVGVYGNRNIGIEEALEKVREYLMFKGPMCHEKFERPISRKYPRPDFPTESFERLAADVEALFPFPPHNALFELMEKHGIDTLPFLHATDPPSTEGYDEKNFPNGDRPDGYENVFQISIADDDDHEHAYSSSLGWNLEHLRPGRKIMMRSCSFCDGDGKVLEKIIKACDKCLKLKDDVRDEYCNRECCGTTARCGDCTSNVTCSTCGIRTCTCRFVDCSVSGCERKMCVLANWLHEYELDDYLENYGGAGCGFEFDPDMADHTGEEFELIFCTVHRPVGSHEACP